MPELAAKPLVQPLLLHNLRDAGRDIGINLRCSRTSQITVSSLVLDCSHTMAALRAREPTPEEMTGWTGLADVARRANLTGDVSDPESPAGALLAATGAYEGGDLCTIEEFAAMDPDVFMEAVGSWTYGVLNGTLPGTLTWRPEGYIADR